MIAVCGEALIDVVERDGVLEPIPGGGPFNTAVALGKLGASVAFLGAISGDRFGDRLVGCLDEAGVDTRYVLRRADPTPLAFVHAAEDGDHGYTFYLADTAYADLCAADLPELPPEVRALAFGTLALAIDPPAGALEVLMRRESRKRLIVLDPNVRPAVFGDREEYRRRFDSWIALADVVKLSDDDAEWLYPGRRSRTRSTRSWRPASGSWPSRSGPRACSPAARPTAHASPRCRSTSPTRSVPEMRSPAGC
jgi:fructokinase